LRSIKIKHPKKIRPQEAKPDPFFGGLTTYGCGGEMGDKLTGVTQFGKIELAVAMPQCDIAAW